LLDHFHRFHFRFIDANLDLLEQGRVDQVWEKIEDQFRAFIGATAFEEVCREWVWRQADKKRLPFMPERVGSHWGAGIQIDVTAINWSEKWLLLGECKWGLDRLKAHEVSELSEKMKSYTEKELADWQVQYMLFARAGLTDAARNVAQKKGIQVIELDQLEN
jgi:AAA+ ATPase superfamily predicted ATPase